CIFKDCNNPGNLIIPVIARLKKAISNNQKRK
ncbi:unnamed protein product, partial [marine sediment metagenome]